MQAEFFAPPMVGGFLKESPGSGQVPYRKCLILAFDDHSARYLVADWENGQQHWLVIDEVQLDCAATYKLHGGEDEDAEKAGDPCPICKRPMPTDD